MDAKAAKTRAFYTKMELNLLVGIMTNNTLIYKEKVKFLLRLFHEVKCFYLTLVCCQKEAVEGAINQAVGTGARFSL